MPVSQDNPEPRHYDPAARRDWLADPDLDPRHLDSAVLPAEMALALHDIAASLRTLTSQNGHALDNQQRALKQGLRSDERLERMQAMAEEAALPTVELLEAAFGLICNVDQGVNVPRAFPHQTAEWVEATTRLINDYNALVGYKHSGSHLPFNTWRQQQRDRLNGLRDKLAEQAKEALDERSQT